MTATVVVISTLLAAEDSLSMGAVFGASLFGMLIGGVVGYLIGNSKGRPGLGVVLGALLGCLGWVIMLIVPRKEPF